MVGIRAIIMGQYIDSINTIDRIDNKVHSEAQLFDHGKRNALST